jgi:hypothetical protein
VFSFIARTKRVGLCSKPGSTLTTCSQDNVELFPCSCELSGFLVARPVCVMPDKGRCYSKPDSFLGS